MTAASKPLAWIARHKDTTIVHYFSARDGWDVQEVLTEPNSEQQVAGTDSKRSQPSRADHEPAVSDLMVPIGKSAAQSIKDQPCQDQSERQVRAGEAALGQQTPARDGVTPSPARSNPSPPPQDLIATRPDASLIAERPSPASGGDLGALVKRLRDFDDECGDGFRLSENDHFDPDHFQHGCVDFDVMRLRREAADAIERLVRERDEAEKVARRWYMASSPYATPEGLAEALRRAEAAERDAARLDALQAMTTGYGIGWVLRKSETGRGMRLHETGSGTAFSTVRTAIDEAMHK